ncbi:MAG: hypothetical protein V4616_14140, partial [Bacteroidota bacterium]
MKIKADYPFLLLLLLLTAGAAAQQGEWIYRRKLDTGVPGNYAMEIAPEVAGKSREDLGDLRIFGIHKKDTVAVPWHLSSVNHRNVTGTRKIEKSLSGDTVKLVFSPEKAGTFDQLELIFDKQALNTRITLEGSNDRNSWTGLLTQQRIGAIVIADSLHRFSSPYFPTSAYSYYRLSVPADIAPLLLNLVLRNTGIWKRDANELTGGHQSIDNSKSKETRVALRFAEVFPVDRFTLTTDSTAEYFRHFTLYTATDSTLKNGATEYHYEEICAGLLSSVGTNTFMFDRVLSRRLLLVINNRGDEALPVRNLMLGIATTTINFT